jgi:hypothetical protein
VRLIPIARWSGLEHDTPITWNGGPMPYLHLNARSRHITDEEIYEVFLEEVNR